MIHVAKPGKCTSGLLRCKSVLVSYTVDIPQLNDS
uniref:Uncharacterized protein n=1 Tax=Anguilla anguilla TaxID=7936 RepID=A0A0E9UI80_ANGAN